MPKYSPQGLRRDRPRECTGAGLFRRVRTRVRPARSPAGPGPARRQCDRRPARTPDGRDIGGDLAYPHVGLNATGTWDQPFLPSYPGAADFRGQQLHAVDYPGPDALAGHRVIVVGGGASAVQFIGELASFDRDAGRAAVALVEERVARGLPPQSVVSVTGLALRPQERLAADMGIFDSRRPMFERILPSGVRRADGTPRPSTRSCERPDPVRQ